MGDSASQRGNAPGTWVWSSRGRMAKILTKWEPEALKAQVKAQLAENAPLVGKFVEGEARRRLDAIRMPDDPRAVRWRWFLSKWVLRNTVEVEEDAVVIRVGMRKGKGSGGMTRGFYVETGSPSAPAHPYLRPAVFQNMREIVQLLTGK